MYITFFIIDQLIFHQMFCGILANTAILLYCIETFCCFCIKTRNTNLHKTSPPHKSKGKMYNTYVHNATLSHQNFLVRHSILTPNPKRRHFALFSVSILLLCPIPIPIGAVCGCACGCRGEGRGGELVNLPSAKKFWRTLRAKADCA